MTDVCLVLMPYADLTRPSLGLGLLKAAMVEQRINTTVLYPNLWWAETIGLEAYSLIDHDAIELLKGEWNFAGAAFPEFQPDHAAYFKWISGVDEQSNRLSVGRLEAEKKLLWNLRERTGAFIERVVGAVLKLQPRIVGCSSTFQQHCASLALLRRIRELAPDVITMLGGANCEGVMGQATHRTFPWADFVVSGEADLIIGDLTRRLLAQGRDLALSKLPPGIFGPAHRRQISPVINLNGAKAPAPRGITPNLDHLPAPCFDDYFAALEESPLRPFINPALAIETSRGCWWGEKHHCTFCGLNGNGMGHRSKSLGRVLTEFKELSQRYNLSKFEVVDNILDMRYLETVLPQLARRSQPYNLFYETKANLKREQLSQLAAAGIRFIQPGIENMHNSALKLLDKGNNALMNVQLLKWALEQGIQVSWNFLVNIPGEIDTWYLEVAEWLPLISHLQPPAGLTPIRLDRFSPYHQQPADFGLKLRPCQTYSYIYPLPPEILAELAYFFEDAAGSGREKVQIQNGVPQRPGLAALYRRLNDWINQWQRAQLRKASSPPQLCLVELGNELLITDTRPCAVDQQHRLTGLAAQIYLACDQAITIKLLLQVLHPAETTWAEVEPVLVELQHKKLILELNGRFLSLAVREPCRPLLKEHPSGSINLLAYKKGSSKVASSSAEQTIWLLTSGY